MYLYVAFAINLSQIRRRYDEETFWIGFTTTQFTPHLPVIENIRI